MKNKKPNKIIIFCSDDVRISYKAVNEIVNVFNNTEIHICEKKINFLRKIKIIFTLLLFGKLKNLLTLIKIPSSKNHLIHNKKIKFVNEYNDEYNFGISFNYPEKIEIKNFKIYNFHLGNLVDQRGSFIFFYKFLYNWKFLKLTFHEIDKDFDKGVILNEKLINIENYDAVEIMLLYFKNLKFIELSLNNIYQKKKQKYRYPEKLNISPSFIKIINTYLCLKFLKIKRKIINH